MKTLIKYMILLLAGGIVIPFYQHTGAVQTAPVNKAVNKTERQIPANGDNLRTHSFIKDAASKLIPILKYF